MKIEFVGDTLVNVKGEVMRDEQYGDVTVGKILANALSLYQNQRWKGKHEAI